MFCKLVFTDIKSSPLGTVWELIRKLLTLLSITYQKNTYKYVTYVTLTLR
jgi:hypothetical protein